MLCTLCTTVAQPPQRKQSVWRIKCLGLLLLVLSAVMLVLGVVAVIALQHLPTLQRYSDVTVVPGDTVLIPISDAWWVQSVDLHLHSQRGCTGTAISILCEHITSTDTVSRSRDIDYLYLVRGSSVASQIPTDTNTYFIWMFPTLEAARKAVDDSFDHISCQNPPPDTLCKFLRPKEQPRILNLTISHTSYYFIRCGVLDSNCTKLGDWELLVVAFNPIQTQLQALDRVNLSSSTVTLHLRSPFHPVIDSSGGVCVLAQLEGAAECGENALVHVGGLTRRLDILLYPGLAMGAAFLLLLTLFVGICTYHIRRNISRKPAN